MNKFLSVITLVLALSSISSTQADLGNFLADTVETPLIAAGDVAEGAVQATGDIIEGAVRAPGDLLGYNDDYYKRNDGYRRRYHRDRDYYN